MVGAGLFIACPLEAIAKKMLSIAREVLGPHDLQVELDLHEEAQLHAEALVQVTAKHQERESTTSICPSGGSRAYWRSHRLVAIAEGLPHRHAGHCTQHDGSDDA